MGQALLYFKGHPWEILPTCRKFAATGLSAGILCHGNYPKQYIHHTPNAVLTLYMMGTQGTIDHVSLSTLYTIS